MTIIRWFRKHNKKLLVGVGIVMMVLFLLPTTMFRLRNRGPSDQAIGNYIPREGKTKEITSFMLGQSSVEIRALSLLGIDRIAQQQSIYCIQYGIPPRFSELALYELIFADSYFGNLFRNYLYFSLEQSDLFKDRDELQQTLEQVDRICGLERASGSLYYFLLTEEARRAGFFASNEHVDQLFHLRDQMKAQGLPLMSIKQVINECRLSEPDLRQAVANYLSVIQYAEAMTSAWSLSEPQLKTRILDLTEQENVEGEFVSFAFYNFNKQVPEPTQEQTLEQFNTYKTYDPGVASEEDPYGFGYRLPDRVQIEYCRAGVDDAEKAVEKSFGQLSPEKQEQTIQKYWEEHKELFKIAVEKPQGQENSAPEYRDPAFDDVVPKARKLWIRQQARDKAEQAIAQLLTVASRSSKEDQCADYQAIQQQLSNDEVPVTYKKTDFLSLEQVQNDPELGYTFQVRNNQRQQMLTDMLFHCEPLQHRPLTRLDATPVKLMEDLGPLLSYRGEDRVQAAYLIRIVGVDAARVPVSLADDGLSGESVDEAFSQVPSGDNLLVDRIKQDWKKLQAYQLAVQEARTFAQQAKEHWDEALAEVNQTLSGDPNQPVHAGPVFADHLSQIRSRIGQFQEMAQQQNSLEIARMIQQQKQFLLEAASLSRQSQSEDCLPVYEQPQLFRCLVFKDLKATAPSEQEYLRQKALLAQQLQLKNQQVMTLSYFDPDNITKRNHFEKIEHDQPNPDHETAQAPQDIDDEM